MIEHLTNRFNFSQLKYQYLAVIIANIVTFCYGYNLGWVSPALTILKSDNSPLSTGPITTIETVLMGALSLIGAMAATVIYSVLSNYISRTTSISLLIYPNLLFWILLITTNTIQPILIGRMISCLTIGGVNVYIPLFVAEISDKKIRGFLGLFLNMNISLGVLMSYICGAFLDYDKVPYVIIGVPLVFLMAMAFLPDTPGSLLKQNKIESAKKSLIFYCNGNQADKNGFDAECELKKLQILTEQRDEVRKQSNLKLIFNRQSLKGLGTGIALVFITVFCGTYAFLIFASQVFQQSNVNFDPNVSAIIMAALQLLGTCLSSVLIDTWGRRKLFGWTSMLCGIALTIFEIFSYMDHQGFDMSSFFWVPVTSVSFFLLINSSGMRPLPFVYVAEMLPV